MQTKQNQNPGPNSGATSASVLGPRSPAYCDQCGKPASAACDCQVLAASIQTALVNYKPKLGREVKLLGSAKPQKAPGAKAAVAGLMPGGRAFMAPSLSPIAKARIFGSNFALYASSLSIISYARVADPTGIASNAAGVQAWANRFAGFQNYRIRATTWEIIPIRCNVGTTTSSQSAGGFEVWLDDSPSSTPTLFAMNDNNRVFVHLNSDKITRLTYRTNEPQDLNLSAIGEPPSHVEGTGVVEGQHSLQCWGDPTYTCVPLACADLQVAIIRPIYDVEFFGIGAN